MTRGEKKKKDQATHLLEFDRVHFWQKMWRRPGVNHEVIDLWTARGEVKEQEKVECLCVIMILVHGHTVVAQTLAATPGSL